MLGGPIAAVDAGFVRRPHARIAQPSRHGATRYATSARASGGFNTTVAASTRRKDTALAAATPYASGPRSDGGCRLARAKVSVPFVAV